MASARTSEGDAPAARAPSLTAAGVTLGVGAAAFFDGIVLHQLLQWHHMLTGERGGEPRTTVAGLEANTLADGLFSAFALLTTLAGIALLWRALRARGRRPAGRHLVALVLLGFGAFNV